MSEFLLSDNHFDPKRSFPCFVKNESYSFGNFNGTSTKWLHLESRIIKSLPLEQKQLAM